VKLVGEVDGYFIYLVEVNPEKYVFGILFLCLMVL